MKEHTQTMGIRKWAGDDLIELQQEPLDALQALVTPYAPCIIQGCVPTPNDDGKTHTVSPGFVALKGKIVRFDGMAKAILPLHLGLDCKTVNRVYADGGNKPIKYHYVAKELNEDTADDSCLTITADDSSNPHLVDAMGITQKLDREGGDASHTKVVFGEENAEELKSGNTLAKLFGSIRQWLCNIKTKLDDLKPGLDGFGIFRINRTLTDAAYQELSLLDFFPETVLAGRTLQVGDFAIETSVYSYMYKITGIVGSTFNCERVCSLRGATGATGATGAEGLGIWRSSSNTGAGNTTISLSSISVPEGRSVKVGDLVIANATYSYLYRVAAVSSTTAMMTFLTPLRGATGAAGQNATTTAVASTTANGLMSAADKTKLDAIEAGAQVNPAFATTSGVSSIPSTTDGLYQTGASNSGSHLNSLGTSNTVARGDHKHSLSIPNASTSKPGLMSKTDKANLDLFAGTPKVIYACSFGVKNGNVSKGQEKAIPGVSVSIDYRTDSNIGKYMEVKTTQNKYSYIIPIFTGQSAGPAFLDGNTGTGTFRIRVMHGTNNVTDIGSATMILIGI